MSLFVKFKDIDDWTVAWRQQMVSTEKQPKYKFKSI